MTPRTIAIALDLLLGVLALATQVVAQDDDVVHLEGHGTGVDLLARGGIEGQVVTADGNSRIRLWNWREKKVLHEFRMDVMDLAVHPEGALVVMATLSDDNAFIVYDTRQKKVVHKLTGHSGTPICVSISPDGKRVLTGAVDEVFRVWDLESGEVLREVRTGYSNSSQFIWSPDGRYVVGLHDKLKVLALWDAKTWKRKKKVELKKRVCELAITDKGKRFSTFDQVSAVEIWDLKKLKVKKRVNCPESALMGKISPDGKTVVFCTQSGRVRFLTAKKGKPIAFRQAFDQAITSMCFTPEGKAVVVGGPTAVADIYPLP